MLVLLALLHGGLKITGHSERFMQSYAALCGCGALLNLAFWPVLLMAGGEAHNTTNAGISLVLLALYAWGVMVNAHIFRHCFDTGMMVGVVISIAYLVVLATVSNHLFAPLTPETTRGIGENIG